MLQQLGRRIVKPKLDLLALIHTSRAVPIGHGMCTPQI